MIKERKIKVDILTKKKIFQKLEKGNSLFKKYGVKKIGLFGSFAKGKQTKNSDIDLLVTFEQKNYGDQYFQVLFHLEDLFKRKIDLIPEDCLRKELNYVRKEAVYVGI